MKLQAFVFLCLAVAAVYGQEDVYDENPLLSEALETLEDAQEAMGKLALLVGRQCQALGAGCMEETN